MPVLAALALTAIAAVAAFAAAAEPLTLTLAQALERAARQSAELTAVRLGVPVAEAGVQSAGALPNPLVAFSVGPDEPAQWGSVEQRFPIFGQRSSAMNAASAEVAVRRAELSARSVALRATVRRAYFSLAAAEAQVVVAADSARLASELAAQVQKKLDAGAAPRLEAEQAALVERRSRQDVLDREAEAAATRLELATVLGDPPDAALAAADPLTPLPAAPPLGELVAQAARHPDVEAARREREAALARADAARASTRPVPDVTLEAEHLAGATPLGVRGTLGLEVPLLSQNGGAIRGAEAEASVAEARAGAAARRLDGAVRAARARWDAAARRSKFLDEDAVPAARHVEELARLAYDLGRAPLFAVLQAQGDVAAARVKAIDAASEAQRAFADLEEAAGVGL